MIARLAGAPYFAQLFVILGFISCAGESMDGDDEAHGGGTSNLGGGFTGGTRASGGAHSGGSARGGSAGAGDGGAPGGTAGSPTGGTSVGGAGDGGAGDGGAGAGGEDGMTAGVCRDPVPWSSGLVACAGNFVHRAAPGECVLPARDETIPNLPPDAGLENTERDIQNEDCDPPWMTCRLVRDDCTRDADCGSGYCVRTTYRMLDERSSAYEFLDILHLCHAPCASDSDCASNELCTCIGVQQNATRAPMTVGACVPADCRTDADCGQGSLCISPLMQLSPREPATEVGSFHCQSPGDECHGPDVCPVDDEYFCDEVAVCSHDGDHFVCGQTDPDDLCSF
jgi:hypothetical protein